MIIYQLIGKDLMLCMKIVNSYFYDYLILFLKSMMSQIVMIYVNPRKMIKLLSILKDYCSEFEIPQGDFLYINTIVIASRKQFKECCYSKRASILIKIKNYSPVFTKDV